MPKDTLAAVVNGVADLPPPWLFEQAFEIDDET